MVQGAAARNPRCPRRLIEALIQFPPAGVVGNMERVGIFGDCVGEVAGVSNSGDLHHTGVEERTPRRRMQEFSTEDRGGPADHAALLTAVATSGDRQAFAALFRHFAPRVKSYLLRLGCETQVAEELTQEVMVSVWRKAASFDPCQASAATWIFAIARNRRIDALRRDRSGALDGEDPSLWPQAPAAADEVVEQEQAAAKVRAAMRGLSAEQAEMIRRAFFEGKAHGAISAETDLPLGTVKSRLRLALARLRRTLEEEGFRE